MDHRQLVEQTILLARKHKLLCHYCADSRVCEGPRGFPDLFVVGQHGGAFIEMKTGNDDTTAEQDQWCFYLYRARVKYRLFRPDDLHNGTIETFFQEIA